MSSSNFWTAREGNSFGAERSASSSLGSWKKSSAHVFGETGSSSWSTGARSSCSENSSNSRHQNQREDSEFSAGKQFHQSQGGRDYRSYHDSHQEGRPRYQNSSRYDGGSQWNQSDSRSRKEGVSSDYLNQRTHQGDRRTNQRWPQSQCRWGQNRGPSPMQDQQEKNHDDKVQSFHDKRSHQFSRGLESQEETGYRNQPTSRHDENQHRWGQDRGPSPMQDQQEKNHDDKVQSFHDKRSHQFSRGLESQEETGYRNQPTSRHDENQHRWGQDRGPSPMQDQQEKNHDDKVQSFHDKRSHQFSRGLESQEETGYRNQPTSRHDENQHRWGQDRGPSPMQDQQEKNHDDKVQSFHDKRSHQFSRGLESQEETGYRNQPTSRHDENQHRWGQDRKYNSVREDHGDRRSYRFSLGSPSQEEIWNRNQTTSRLGNRERSEGDSWQNYQDFEDGSNCGSDMWNRNQATSRHSGQERSLRDSWQNNQDFEHGSNYGPDMWKRDQATSAYGNRGHVNRNSWQENEDFRDGSNRGQKWQRNRKWDCDSTSESYRGDNSATEYGHGKRRKEDESSFGPDRSVNLQRLEPVGSSSAGGSERGAAFRSTSRSMKWVKSQEEQQSDEEESEEDREESEEDREESEGEDLQRLPSNPWCEEEDNFMEYLKKNAHNISRTPATYNHWNEPKISSMEQRGSVDMNRYPVSSGVHHKKIHNEEENRSKSYETTENKEEFDDEALSYKKRNKRKGAWVKKNMFKNAAPIKEGIGMMLLKKMGWTPGEGLGKDKSGITEPVVIKFTMDKKGISTSKEMKIIKKANNLTVNQKKKQKKREAAERLAKLKETDPEAAKIEEEKKLKKANVRTEAVQLTEEEDKSLRDYIFNRHPVQAVIAVAAKVFGQSPTFRTEREKVKTEKGSKKALTARVMVNTVVYEAPLTFDSKQIAKNRAAMLALKDLGYEVNTKISQLYEKTGDEEPNILRHIAEKKELPLSEEKEQKLRQSVAEKPPEKALEEVSLTKFRKKPTYQGCNRSRHTPGHTMLNYKVLVNGMPYEWPEPTSDKAKGRAEAAKVALRALNYPFKE